MTADKLRACPKCGCPDEIEIDSSSIANASWAECHYCEYRLQLPIDEDLMVEHWNSLDRTKMPEFRDD